MPGLTFFCTPDNMTSTDSTVPTKVGLGIPLITTTSI